MDAIDKFLKKYSYKFPKGYPDLNDTNDVELLNKLLEGLNVDVFSQKIEEAEEAKDTTDFGKKLFEIFKGKIPAVKGTYSLDNLNLTSEDKKTFTELYSVIPGQNVGKGELALYWLFNYKNPKKPSNNIQKQKDKNIADFIINGKPVELKGYKSLKSKIALGKFKEDIESRDLINNIFGIINLSNIVGQQGKLASEVNFNLKDLKEGFTRLIELKNIFFEPKLKSQIESIEGPNILKTVLDNISELVNTKLKAISESLNPEDLAKDTLIKLVLIKLEKKPGLGNYIMNISPSLEIESILIPADAKQILEAISFEDIEKYISVASAEIQFNFSIFSK